MIKHILTTFILGFFCFAAGAQNKLKFRLAEQVTLPYDSSNEKAKRYGGISAIEYFNNDSILLASDHDGDGYSYIFTMNTSYKILHSERFENLKGIECLRYNKQHHQYFYSFENNTNTGIGYIDNGNPITLFTESIPSANTSNNRGIEGITFGSDNSLWVAFEAGGSTTCQTGTIPFYRLKRGNGAYDENNKTAYQYPFERCSCSMGQFNASLGNGISEILAVKNTANKILVLERCFSGLQAKVQLYLATVPLKGDTLQKELVFDFNNNATFDAKNKNYTPDNLEGMAWGADENGKRVLYLVSDNNYRPFQRNQLVKLVEE